MDRELVTEALQTAATADGRYGSDGAGWKRKATAGDKAVRSLRRKLNVFLEDLPGEMSIEELRDALTSRGEDEDTVEED